MRLSPTGGWRSTPLKVTGRFFACVLEFKAAGERAVGDVQRRLPFPQVVCLCQHSDGVVRIERQDVRQLSVGSVARIAVQDIKRAASESQQARQPRSESRHP